MTTKILPIQRPISAQRTPVSLNGLLLHVLPSTLLILAIWAPFGFDLVGNIEEWNILGMFVNYGLFFVTDVSSPLPIHALRPLTILPQAIAYYLDSHSFFYWNVLSALSLIIKGICASLLIKRITKSGVLAVAAALLIIIYPADTMQLSFRSIHINWALSLLLSASILQLKAVSGESGSWTHAMVASGLVASACSMYEASILLSPLPLLTLFAANGLKDTLGKAWQHLGKHALWFFGVLVYIGYVIYTAPHVKSYQSNISGQDTLATLQHSFPHLFSIGLLRTALGGWYDAMLITYTEFSNYWYAILVLTGIFGVVVYLLKTSRNEAALSVGVANPVTARILVVGILLTLLGYAPFLLSLSHQSISQRTFLFASLGGVLMTISVAIVIIRYLKPIGGALLAALFLTGFCTQLYQFNHYLTLGEREKAILTSIVQKLDEPFSAKQVIVLDKTSELNDTWMFLASNLRAALTYVYGHDFAGIQICRMPSHEWQEPDNLARKGSCEETSDEWVFHYQEAVTGPYIPKRPELPAVHIKKSAAVVVVADPDGEAGQPLSPKLQYLSRADNQSYFAKIYRNVLSPGSPALSMAGLTDPRAKDYYHWNFGDWWSLELPVAGSGWRPAEWTVNNFHHDAIAWITNDLATLNFTFTPLNHSYTLSGEFTDFINSTIRENLTMAINGKSVPLTWSSPGQFSGDIPDGSMVAGVNIISISAKVDPSQYGLSGRLTRIQVDPNY